MKENNQDHYSNKGGHKERSEINKALGRLRLERDYAWMLRRSMRRTPDGGKK